ncbi:hypothetical protein TNCV_525181 [Trichonephila clavipes]|nr:hypothetical protein TNCV_525181 [Trichonephila clavipes]
MRSGRCLPPAPTVVQLRLTFMFRVRLFLQSPQLKAIATMSVGYDHIDTKTCKEKNYLKSTYNVVRIFSSISLETVA